MCSLAQCLSNVTGCSLIVNIAYFWLTAEAAAAGLRRWLLPAQWSRCLRIAYCVMASFNGAMPGVNVAMFFWPAGVLTSPPSPNHNTSNKSLGSCVAPPAIA
jgi:hypothetical protein